MEKRCPKCKVVKPIDDFSVCTTEKSGRQSSCKKCQSKHAKEHPRIEYLKKWYQEHKESRQIASREYSKAYIKKEEVKEKRRNNQQNYRNNNPEKIAARNAVGYAVDSGRIPKATSLKCSVCKQKQAEHYHHYKGYNKDNWFSIIPVCRICHKEIENK